jgi:hypothetical protein
MAARSKTRAERNIAWIEEYCRVPEGRMVGQPVKLRPWQRDIIRGIYGDAPVQKDGSAKGEWEARLSSPEPEVAAIPGEAGPALASLLGSAELRPLFSTRVQRQVRRLKVTNGKAGLCVVEAALDLSTIEANERSMPLAEVRARADRG